MNTSLTFSLHEMVYRMDELADRLLAAKFQISFRKFHVLTVLASCEPTSQANLALCIGQSPAAISKSVALLVEDGFVEVRTDPGHARTNIVTLTPMGRKVARESAEFLEAEFSGIVRSAGVNQADLIASTKAINQHLENRG